MRKNLRTMWLGTSFIYGWYKVQRHFNSKRIFDFISRTLIHKSRTGHGTQNTTSMQAEFVALVMF